jgi:hypothetical protein
MAGNTRPARSDGNLVPDSDPDDDTTNNNSLDTEYLLMRTGEHSLAPLPFNTIRISPAPRAGTRTPVLTLARSSPLVNSTTG